MKRFALTLVAALSLLAAPVFTATATLIPEAVRGAIAFGHPGDPTVSGCPFCGPTPVHINAGTPANNGNIDFTIISSVWPTTAGLTMRVIVERSLDGGATWAFLMGNDPTNVNDVFVSNQLNKAGQPALARFGTRWDGSAMDLRGTFTPNQSFSWGLSAAF